MKPTDFSAGLRRIASAIDASKHPSKSLVANAIKTLIRRIAANNSSISFEILPSSPLANDDGHIGSLLLNSIEASSTVDSADLNGNVLTVHLPLATPFDDSTGLGDGTYPTSILHGMLVSMRLGEKGPELQKAASSLGIGTAIGFGPDPLPFDLDDSDPEYDDLTRR